MDRSLPSETSQNMSYFTIKWHSFIILRTISPEEKSQYRKTERSLHKCIKLNHDINYNNICKKNELVPKYTKIKLYDKNLQNKKVTEQFRSELVDHEIKKQKKDLFLMQKELTVSLIYIYIKVAFYKRFYDN